MQTLLHNAYIINGLGGLVMPGWVLLEDSAIKAVGESEPLPQDSDRAIDLAGKTLLPGLIDCHVHMVLDASPDPANRLLTMSEAEVALTASVHARQTLEAGITTVRDLGCMHHVSFRLRDAIQNGLVPGPRMICAGQMICMTGGHGWQIGLQADGPSEVRKAVRKQLRAGADVIKLMATGGICTDGVDPGQAQLTVEELRAGIEEAHKAGRRTSAHAQGLQGVKNAVEAGIDTVEHGMQLDDEVLGWMQERGVFLVPTFSAGAQMIRHGEKAGIPSFMVKKSIENRQSRLASARKAIDKGVMVAFGTDAGTPYNLHGQNAYELQEMVSVGMSPDQAICAATSTAARVLGLDSLLGSIEHGKQADILVVEGDPLADISILQDKSRIVAVIQNGQFVAGNDILTFTQGEPR